jgi:putative salt-induced outer membrane protein YdiY
MTGFRSGLSQKHLFKKRIMPNLMPLRFSVRLFAAVLASTLLASLAAPALHADTVVLKNGDRLTGTAVKLEAGKLTFKTAYADSIAIAWDHVTSLTTRQPLVLPTPKGNLSVTSIERSGTGLLVAAPSGPATLDSAAVTVLRSPADQKAYETSLRPDWGHAWAGALNVSLALARGNSDTATFGAGFTAARTTRADKTSLYANTLYSENSNAVPSTSANTTAGGLRYDHNLNPKLFAFGTGDFSTNALQDLDLRSIIGGGFGWHASKSAKQTFDVLGGLVWTHETYSPGPTNSFAALDLGEIYTRKVGAGSLFTEQAYIYPDLNQLSQVQLSADSSFSTRIGKIFNWQTTFSDRYTSFPPPGKLRDDVILTTGLGLTLARP